MPLVKNAATSLAQGVSQQAESQRYPSQATEQINAYSSPIKGLVKRPPSKFLTKVDLDTTNRNNTFIHTINRDSDERYVLAIDKATENAVTAVNAGASGTVTLTTALPANTAIRFISSVSEGELPSGIEDQQTYYTTASTATTGLSKTVGGSAITIGKKTITKLEIEAVKHTDGRWVDGVFAVTFAANHGLTTGDVIQINGLSGDAALILPADQEYILRKPTQDMAIVNSSGVAQALPANKFLLGRINGDANSLNDNLGYVVDERWITDGDDDGWNLLGNPLTTANSSGGNSTDAIHWQFKKDNGSFVTSSTSGTDLVVNKMVYNSTDATDFADVGWNNNLSQFQVGDLLRLGSRYNTDKSVRVKITAVGDATDRTLTFDYANIGTLFDSNPDASDRWNYLAYWGDTTNSAPAASNPRQFLATDYSNATVGTDENWEAFKGITGGIRVYDVKTGAEKTVNMASGLDYVTSTNDPASDLKAVTIADYTFLINKTKKTEVDSKIKYKQSHEAFVTVRTADYGKNYSLKIGGEVNKEYSGSAIKSNFVVSGLTENGEIVDLGKIEAKTAGTDLNGYQIRLIQNWEYTEDADKRNIIHNKHDGQGAGEANFSQYTDLLPPDKHRVNKYVGIEWKPDENIINIWCNFHWAKGTPSANVTTLEHLTKAIEQHAIGAKFKFTKTHADDADKLKLNKIYLGSRGKKYDITYERYSSYGGGREERLIFYVGSEENIGSTRHLGLMDSGKWLVAKEGYLSPSAKDNIIVRRDWIDRGFNEVLADNHKIKDNVNRKVENGEFFYKSPKWTGQDTQPAIGTERIAQMLASDAHIAAGTYVVAAPVQANGLPIYPVHGTNEKEDCIGLSYSYTNKGRLANFHGNGRIDGWEDSDWSVLQQGYTIAIKNPEGSKFNIQVSDDLGGRGLKLTYFEVDEEADLPDVCRHGHIVKVVGNPREDADDYYLKFEADVADPTELRHGRWVESMGTELPCNFDKATMPVGLVREANGTFTLKELDWNERQAGDDQSNPFPSFIGNTIDDIFLFRNRLGFLSGENIIFSEAGEYFNFFRTTVAALLDTAPIDVTASTNKVSKLHSAIPYNERLIIFSDQTQFVLDADPFLSPKTVTLSPSNEIDNITSVKPIVSGNSVYYAFSRTGYSGVGELGVSQEDADQMEVSNVTAHVPKYIKGNIRKIAATSNEDVICCITDDETAATLYVYKYFNNEQNQKVQSAWFKYNFGTPNANPALSDYITDISFIDTTLYILIRRNGVMYIETLTFEDDVKDAKASGTMDYQVCLDHRIDKPSSGVTSSSVTLPSNYKVTSTMKLVDEDGNQFSSSTHGNTNVFTCTVPTSKNFFIGEPYTMEYTFSQPFLKSAKATETGRYQIQRAYLEYANARYFTVDVLHNPNLITSAQTNVTNTFSLSIIEQGLIDGTSELQNGFYAFAIQEKNDRLQLTLKNDSPYPSDFLSIDYEARAFSRGSRWRG